MKNHHKFLCNAHGLVVNQFIWNLSWILGVYNFLVTVKSQPPKGCAFRRCGVSAKFKGRIHHIYLKMITNYVIFVK